MKPIYHLLIFIILLSCLVLFPCSSHPTVDRNRTTNIQCIDTERDALLRFKRGITRDQGGLLTSWGSYTNCCQWNGVVCSDLTDHIISLNLTGGWTNLSGEKYLQGKVSPSLGELKHLKFLNLSGNWFVGEIPRQLGNLSRLTTLDLGRSFGDTGVQKISSWIPRLSRLRYLDLSWANLSNVTDWMTIVNNLHSLSVLRMDSCELPPKIPLSLSYLNSSTTLHTISLSNNHFNDGSIFQWLFNFHGITTQLEYLDLSWNEFQLALPNEFENFHNLSHLSLSVNGFQGSILKVISKLCNLKQLDLGDNNFTDELSNVIQSLLDCNNKALSTLELSQNSFWGTIPDSISSLSSLKELKLNDNKLEGEINQGTGQLIRLEILQLSFNSFEGTLTHTLFQNLVNLVELDLSDNLRLVVNINENWIPPFQLDFIGLRSCQLGPQFPKWLQLQANFSYFDVSNTGISDTIPISFWNSLSSDLTYLNMSYNKLYGMIPATLPNRPDTSFAWAIDLSSNLFAGVVPSWFASASFLSLNDNSFDDCSILCPKTTNSLGTLDLSNNLFFGELPNCWMNFSQLTSLHLENNNFSGRIWNIIMPQLEYVHLYNNSFSGPFPTAFKICTYLKILNLGHNLFTGHIPPWIDNSFQYLGALMLRENHFIGEIPLSICHLNNLQMLDIAGNHISGVIPKCIGFFGWMSGVEDLGMDYEFSVVEFKSFPSVLEIGTIIVSWKGEEQRFKNSVKWVKLIDLSSNELSGEIPSEISLLNGLQSLDLSRNKLIGKIPSEIGNMTALEFLDLSNNHLTGKIPISLAKVTTLGTLDVSNNNLSGEIPLSTQLQGFNISSYAGNPGLCGTPLPSCSKDGMFSKNHTSIQDKNDKFVFFLGLYISVALGFITGFWMVFGTLVFKTSWRHAYFRFLGKIKDRQVILKLLWKIGRHNHD